MRYFVAVAEDLNFGRAAARLHVVQPAISQQIRLLEIGLGVQLLNRSSRKVSLTDAGRAYLAQARQALLQFEYAGQAAREAAGGVAGTLAVGFVDNALWCGLPRMVKAFCKRFPRVDLTLVQMPRSAQIQALERRDIDVGILPAPLAGEVFAARELARAPLYVALPHGHPFCDRRHVDMRDLAGETFIAIPSVRDPRRINDIMLEMCADAGFTPSFGQPVQQLQTGISLVSAGLGVLIVPQWLSRAWNEDVEYRQLLPKADYVLLIATLQANVRPIVRSFLSVMDDFLADRGNGRTTPVDA